MEIDVSTLISGQVFAFMLIFTRLSAGLMLFPGIGEAFVPAKIRFMFSFVFAFLLCPVLEPFLPAMPSEIGQMVKLIVFEALVGLFFGVIMRLMVGIVETTGSIIAMQIGLSNAMILNPSLGAQSALTSVFLSVSAITLIFVTGFDALLLRALVGTYDIFPVGGGLPWEDAFGVVVRLVSQSFALGVQMAAPFMITGLLIYSTIGVMQRLMPQIQLFLVMLPVQIWGGLFVFGLCLSSMLTVWLVAFDQTVGEIFIR